MEDLYVFDRQLNLLGEISEYINLEINRNTDSYSELILNIQSDPENISLLKGGNILTTQKNPNYGFVIEHFSYLQEGRETLEVVAFSLNYWLTYRTIFPQQYKRGTVDDVVKHFVNLNAISPSDTNRVIPNLVLGQNTGVNNLTTSSKTGGDLLEHVLSVANSYNASVDILMNFENKNFELVVWKGLDRSIEQNSNPYVVFSEDYDNIIKQNYFISSIDYKNTSIVAGAGEGVDRTIVSFNEDNIGLNRREKFVDARDLQRTYQDENGNEITLTESEYTSALLSRGQESLNDSDIIESFEAQIDNEQFIYGRDFFIGDKISVRNYTLGVVLSVYIKSVNMVSNSKGTVVLPSLGSGIPKLDLKRR